ncbi:MAG: hypothetical protein ACLQVI_39430 [Polyangiaceae bacterium]
MAALALAGPACSILTSLNNLDPGPGPGEAGASNDAPSSNDSGGIVTPGEDAGDSGEDAALEAASNDSGPLDATPDGPPSAYCASFSPQSLFCDDFDEDTQDAAALAAPWDQVTGVGGTVTRSGGIFTSPTLAMLVTTKAGAASIDLCGYKSFTAVPKVGEELSLAFDLYVVQADTTTSSDAVLAAIELIDALGDRWALQLELTYDGIALDVNFSENDSVVGDASTTYTSHPVATRFPIGAWTRVTMEVTVGPPFTATLSFGSTAVAKQVPVTPHTISGHPEILVGGTYAQQSTEGWIVRYDDVTFDVDIDQ